MGVDVLALRVLGVGLLTWLGYSYIYVRFLDWLAHRRGTQFFWPGFLGGVLGVAVLAILLQSTRVVGQIH